MRGDIMYLLLVIGAFSLFFTVILWLQVTDARYRRAQALFDGRAEHAQGRKAKHQKT
jgi:hypothetical protein